MKTFKQSIISIVIGLILAAGVSFASHGSWHGATDNPPNQNAPAPINVSSATQYKTGALGIGGMFQVEGSSKFKKVQIQDGTQGLGKILTSDSVGNATWQTQETPPKPLSPIFCGSYDNEATGRVNGDHHVLFKPNECTGGVLPDANYVGALVKLQVCYGFKTVQVFSGGSAYGGPGVYFYGDSEGRQDYDTCGEQKKIRTEAIYIPL